VYNYNCSSMRGDAGRDRIMSGAKKKSVGQTSSTRKDAASYKARLGTRLRLCDPPAADDQGSIHGMNANHEIKGHSDCLLLLHNFAKCACLLDFKGRLLRQLELECWISSEDFETHLVLHVSLRRNWQIARYVPIEDNACFCAHRSPP
jgi:hypothetical protein